MREANPTENADRLQTLFDIITKCSSTLEKRLVIDVKWVKDAYEDFLISDVGFVRTQNNPVDTVTKLGTCAVLFYIIPTSKANFKIVPSYQEIFVSFRIRFYVSIAPCGRPVFFTAFPLEEVGKATVQPPVSCSHHDVQVRFLGLVSNSPACIS